MGARYLTWARRVPLGAERRAPVAAQRLVLLMLADNANHNGEAWPAVATLAGTAGLSRSTVKAALAALEAGGLIRAPSGRSRGGRGLTTRWQLTAAEPPVLRAVTANGDEPQTGRSAARLRNVKPAADAHGNRPQKPAAVRPRTRNKNPQL